MVAPELKSAKTRSQGKSCSENLLAVHNAKLAFQSENPGKTLSTISQLSPYLKYGVPKCPSDGTDYVNVTEITLRVACPHNGDAAFETTTGLSITQNGYHDISSAPDVILSTITPDSKPSDVGGDFNYTFDPVNPGGTVVPPIAPGRYYIQTRPFPAIGGDTTPTKTEFTTGASVAITAVPKIGWSFVEWRSESGEYVFDDTTKLLPTQTINPPPNNIKLVAIFQKNIVDPTLPVSPVSPTSGGGSAVTGTVGGIGIPPVPPVPPDEPPCFLPNGGGPPPTPFPPGF